MSFTATNAITEALAEYKPIERQISDALPNTENYIINGVWDENGYKAAKSALRDAKKVAREIESKRKELKAIALEYGRAVDNEAKRLIELCNPTISTLERRIANVEMEREKIKHEKRHKRHQELISAGFEFSVGAYRIGSEVVYPTAIDDANEDDWKGILDRGKEAKIKVDQQRAKEQAERQALAEARRKIEAKLAQLQKMRREAVDAQRADEPTAAQSTSTPPTYTEPSVEVSAEPTREPYAAGFDACRTLSIEAVRTIKNRADIIKAIEQFTI